MKFDIEILLTGALSPEIDLERVYYSPVYIINISFL